MTVKSMIIAPHGTIALPQLKYKIKAPKTVKAFAKLKKNVSKNGIDHWIVVDPHEKINTQKFTLFNSITYTGFWKNGENSVSCSYLGDTEVQNNIQHCIGNSLLTAKNTQNHKLSWGSMVPLISIASNQSISLLSIDRNINTQQIKRTGKKIYNTLQESNKNIGIIFSCDLSHSHSKANKNFRYNPQSKVYDTYVQKIIDNQLLETYNEVPNNVVSMAVTDAHAQLTMLSGICESIKYSSILYSYEVPSYFGMAIGEIQC